MEHKRGTEGDRSFKLGDRLKDPAVVVVLLFLAFGVYSLFSSDITGKLIARPQNECSVAGGAASGVMLLGNAGPFQLAGAVQKQSTCGVPAQRPAGELKQFLLLGTRCEAGADGVITLSLENGNTQRLKSACALPSYDETPHSNKLVKHACAGNDVQVNLINCNCLNADCAIPACANNDQCLALPDGASRNCQDKNNGLGMRCYLTEGKLCAQNFADECGQGLVCQNGQCISAAAALAAPAAPPVPPVPLAPAVPPENVPAAPRSPVELQVDASLVSVVGRMINPIDPLAGAEVTVTLIVNEVGEEGSYIIEEAVPAGWEIIESAGFERNENQLTIGPIIEGMGGTVQDTRYTYKIRAPQEPSQGTFTGTFRFESMAEPQALIGDTVVSVPSVGERYVQLSPELKEGLKDIAIERGALPVIDPAVNPFADQPPQPVETILVGQELKLGDAASHSKFAVITFTPTFEGDSPFITFVLTTLGMTGADSPGFAENYALVYNKDGSYEIFRLNDQIQAGAGEQPVRIEVAKERLKNNDLNFLYLVAGSRNNDYADFGVKKIVVEGATLGPEILVNDYTTAGERAAGMLGQLEGVLIAHKAGGRLKQTGEACQEDQECSSRRCVGTEVGRRCAAVGANEAGNQQPPAGGAAGCVDASCPQGKICRWSVTGTRDDPPASRNFDKSKAQVCANPMDAQFPCQSDKQCKQGLKCMKLPGMALFSSRCAAA